jgi:hypothetical protein
MACSSRLIPGARDGPLSSDPVQLRFVAIHGVRHRVKIRNLPPGKPYVAGTSPNEILARL